MTLSTLIDQAISLSLKAGNAVVEISTGWTKMREVVEMRDPLTKSLRSEIRKLGGLREFRHEGAPHSRADEGFIDDTEKVAMSFPLADDGPALGHRRLIWIPAGLMLVALSLLIAAMLHIRIG